MIYLVKLTQEFIEEDGSKSKRDAFFHSRQFHQSIHNSKYNYSLQQTFKRLDSALMKLVIAVDVEQPEGGG